MYGNPDFSPKTPNNKSVAKQLLWVVLFLLVVLPLACAVVAHGQEVDPDQLVLTSAIVSGANMAPSYMAEEEKKDLWTVEVSWSNRSAFKAFGSVASDDPISGLSLTYADDNWDVFILGVVPIGTHEDGVIADFIDPIIQRKFSFGDWWGKAGIEVFYGPSYRGGASSTFIGPLASIGKKVSDQWSVEFGTQYVGTHNTPYDGGDRLYVYGEVTYAYKKGPWTLSLSGGVIGSDKERYSVYGKPKVAYQLSWVEVQLSLLRSESDSRTGRFAIPATSTLSAIWTF